MPWEARAGRVVAGQPQPAMMHPLLLPPAPNVTCPELPETRSTRNPFCGTFRWRVALQSWGGGGWGSQPHLARCRGTRRPPASLEHKPLGSSDAGEPVLLLRPHLGLHPCSSGGGKSGNSCSRDPPEVPMSPEGRAYGRSESQKARPFLKILSNSSKNTARQPRLPFHLQT